MIYSYKQQEKSFKDKKMDFKKRNKHLMKNAKVLRYVGMKKILLIAALSSIACLPFTSCNQEMNDSMSSEQKTNGSTEFSFAESVGGTYIVSGVGACTDEEIIIPATYQGKPVVAVGTDAFSNNENIKKVILSENINRVDYAAFRNCDALVSVSVSASVKKIDQFAFADCNALKEVIFSENAKLEAIDYSAFESCTSLERIVLPISLTRLAPYSFKNCTALQKVDIPEGTSLNYIGWAVFWGCQSLIEIRIPAAVTYIEYAVFKDCTALERVFVGTQEEFAQMTYNNDNALFKMAKKYYYSETAPIQAGDYWHFENGEIVIWE